MEKNIEKDFVFRAHDGSIYVEKIEGKYQVFVHWAYKGDNFDDDSLWIKEEIEDLWILRENAFLVNGCYAVVKKDKDNNRLLIDVIRKEVLKEFKLDSFIGSYYKELILNNSSRNFKYAKDRILVFNDEENKEYALFSLFEKKYIFGPYKYRKIKNLRQSDILNGIYYIDCGIVENLSRYKFIYHPEVKVYTNRRKNKYFMLIKDENEMYEAENENNVLSVRTDSREYRFDLGSKEFYWYEIEEEKMSLHDYLHQWDGYEDIAFEGYSREYLGID